MPDEQIDLVKEARELLAKIPKGPWVRDGSIVSDHVEIDLRLDDEGDNWITIKGDEDEIVESIATTVIRTPEFLKALCDEVERLRDEQKPQALENKPIHGITIGDYS